MARRERPAERVVGPVEEATEVSIARATHLTELDAGAVAVLRDLARKIDDRVRVEQAWAEGLEYREDPKPLPIDNVTAPTYLRYCESLGLTPAGREKLGAKKDSPGGKLATLRAIRGGADDVGDAQPKRSRSARPRAGG